MKTCPPVSDANRSSTSGKGYSSTFAYLLTVTLKSSKIHTDPSPLITGTTGAAQSENWTGEITFSLCNFSNSFSTLVFRAKGRGRGLKKCG